MNVNMIKEYGPFLVDPDDGAKFFSRLAAALGRGEDVFLDFEGVEVYVSIFFNPSIGTLLSLFPPEVLNSRLHFENLNDDGLDVIRRVIEASTQYYANASVRTAVDRPLD